MLSLKKKIFISGLSILMAVGLPQIAHAETPYAWKDAGVLQNDGEKYEYRGMADVTRQDMAAFLYRWAGSPAYSPSTQDTERFVDVSSATPHAKEIWWLAREGISTGWQEENGTYSFRGMASVTRQDMAAFMHRLVGDAGVSSTENVFADVDIYTPHQEDITWLANKGVSQGWIEPDGSRTFRGSQAVKRQDMAAFLYRLAGSPASPENDNKWVRNRYVDVNESTPHARDIYWLTLEKISTGWIYVAPNPKPAPKPAPKYKDCTEVWRIHKKPLRRGEPGYTKELDRDNDGIACEVRPKK